MKEILHERAITQNKFGNICLDCAKWETVPFEKLKTGDIVRIRDKGAILFYQLGEKENDSFVADIISAEEYRCNDNA